MNLLTGGLNSPAANWSANLDTLTDQIRVFISDGEQGAGLYLNEADLTALLNRLAQCRDWLRAKKRYAEF